MHETARNLLTGRAHTTVYDLSSALLSAQRNCAHFGTNSCARGLNAQLGSQLAQNSTRSVSVYFMYDPKGAANILYAVYCV